MKGFGPRQNTKITGVHSSRKSQTSEAYLRLFYASKILPEVNAELAKLPPGVDKKAKRLTLMNNLARKMYEDETDDIKKLVQDEIERTHQQYLDETSNASNGERTPIQYSE